ncbi:MAG: type VI secretion system protein TssA [Rhodopirellula sp. JB055]|uniref:type VI secretion system protein TssA n=1 Tax=Rhodopirellula sp. JB055 TaxID=3342846 RepID=UPI00370A0D67
MTIADLSTLTAPVSPDSPTGVSLEYDARFVEMTRLAEGTREQQYGKTVIAAQPPDWRAIHQLAIELASETRDLRLAVLLVECQTHLKGLDGLTESMTLLRDWVRDHWDDVHPQLDPDDNNDPFIRINALGRLCEPERLPSMIGRMTLVESLPHVVVTLNDVRRSRGELNATSSADSPTPMEVEAAFLAFPVAELRHRYEACQRAENALQETVDFLEQHLGTGIWETKELSSCLSACSQLFKTHLRQRLSVSDAAVKDVSGDECEPAASHDASNQWDSEDVDESIVSLSRIRVQSREEAAQALDAATRYFELHEPSSPVPLLLRRARRMINQDFVDIIRELAPDALSQARNLAGQFDD